MILFNFLELVFQLEMLQWLFGAFAFFGVMLLVKKLAINKGID